MLGSIFQITKVHNNDDEVLIINLTLCSDDDHQLKAIFEHMGNEDDSGEEPLLSFGNALVDMGKFDEAEKYYHRLLYYLSPNHHHIARCYHSLGNVTNGKGNYESSLQ